MAKKEQHTKKTTAKGRTSQKGELRRKNGGRRTGAQSTRASTQRKDARPMRVAAGRAQAAALSARKSGQESVEQAINTIASNTKQMGQLAEPQMETGTRMVKGGMELADTMLRATLSWARLGTAAMGAWQRGMMGAGRIAEQAAKEGTAATKRMTTAARQKGE